MGEDVDDRDDNDDINRIIVNLIVQTTPFNASLW
jgi:hypothetical protein